MAVPYTSGEWIALPGHEDEFAAAWRELASWASETIPGTGRAVLLRDRADPRRFVSFGPWADDAAIEAFRAHPDFRQRVERMPPLLERFAAHTLDLAAEAG